MCNNKHLWHQSDTVLFTSQSLTRTGTAVRWTNYTFYMWLKLTLHVLQRVCSSGLIKATFIISDTPQRSWVMKQSEWFWVRPHFSCWQMAARQPSDGAEKCACVIRPGAIKWCLCLALMNGLSTELGGLMGNEPGESSWCLSRNSI